MNVWTDSERRWALESESKPEILRKTSATKRYVQLSDLKF